MDYKAFITSVEEHLKEMSEKQKTKWIYELARKTPKDQRCDFLNKLCGHTNIRCELSVEEINNWCDEIEEGNLYFDAEEYYSDNDWNDQWEIIYHDKHKIVPFFEKAVRYAYQCLIKKEYQAAEVIINRLLSLEFTYHEEYSGECGTLTVNELISNELMTNNLNTMAFIQLYSCYQLNETQSRIHKLYHYFQQRECNGIVLTDLFAFGPERIKDEAEFTKQWCAFLKEQEGNRAATLLRDACLYIGGTDYLLQSASECAKLHPSLYLAYCKRMIEDQEYEKCIQATKTALTLIDADKAIRGDLCDFAILASKRTDRKDLNFFYTEAFCAKPDAMHLLHFLTIDDASLTEKVSKIINNRKVIIGLNTSFENRTATFQSENLKAICCFMLGKHHEQVRQCQNDNKSLGWSVNIKGVIVPLLLLALKKQEGQRTLAEEALMQQLEDSISYQDIHEDFLAAFQIWHKSFQITEKEKEEYIKWLHKEITERAHAILSGQYRKSYWKAAALIIVLGFVEAENGIPHAKELLFAEFKTQHSRLRGFWSEMENLAQTEA